METIISSLISAGVALLICIVQQNRNRVLLEYRLDELTREVREHNDFAHRMPVIEERIGAVASRVDKLEGKAS